MGEPAAREEDAPERGLLVAVLRQGADAEGELAEMRELLRTAHVDVVATSVQHRPAPHPSTYVGKGKLAELVELAKEVGAEVVVAEDELSPSQQRKLEDATGMRVVDRTAVILDIFADHAHTTAGKLQVELAQLEYNLTRMRGLWKHLERLGGGIGTRGPGESQLETDRRLARDRISLIKRRLRDERRHRATMRKARERNAVPTVALAGYTNVGKSTLLNALTGAQVSSADRLFETLDPTTRAYEYLGRRYLMTDTVGFVRKLPHQLVEAFASTLEETLRGDLVVHVADAALDEDARAAQVQAVEDVLDEIGASELPRLLVLNKADLCTPEALQRLRNRHPDAAICSARSGEGLDEVERRIAEHFAGRFEEVELLVPHAHGAAIAELYELGAPIIEREDTEDGVRVRAHLPLGLARRYERFAVRRNGGGP